MIVHPIFLSYSTILSASYLVAYLANTFGSFSTASLASLRPNPHRLLTSLIILIF